MYYPKLTIIIAHQILIFVQINSFARARSYNRCFLRVTRHSIDNSQPLIEIFHSSLHDCLEMCVMTTGNQPALNPLKGICRSLVYDHLQHSCRLYDHDGAHIPAVLHPANGFDFFRRTAVTQECGGPIQKLLSSRARVVAGVPISKAKTGKPVQVLVSSEVIVENHRHSHAANGTSVQLVSFDTAEEPAKSASKEARRHRAETVMIVSSEISKNSDYPSWTRTTMAPPKQKLKAVESENSINNGAGKESKKAFARGQKTAIRIRGNNELENKNASDKATETSNSKGEKLIISSPSSDGNCSTSMGYYAVLGNEIILPIFGSQLDVVIIEECDQSSCVNYCSKNIDNKGGNFKCMSFNYFPTNQKCELYGILAEPHGSGTLVENNEAVYAEKFCMPKQNLLPNCGTDEIFPLHAQKKIVATKKPIKVVSSRSISECLGACLGGTKCRTVVFDSNNKLCQLYALDLNEQQADVTEESPTGWVLIENGCYQNSMARRRRKMQNLLPKKRPVRT